MIFAPYGKFVLVIRLSTDNNAPTHFSICSYFSMRSQKLYAPSSSLTGHSGLILFHFETPHLFACFNNGFYPSSNPASFLFKASFSLCKAFISIIIRCNLSSISASPFCFVVHLFFHHHHFLFTD